MNPLVSVVIPLYNCEEYIDDGLTSVFNQTYQNIEVICVDNNSNQAVKDKLKEWQRRKPELILLEEKRQGAPYARNLGTKKAKGDWIQYFDIDDILLPNKIKHQVTLIEAFESPVDFVIEGRIVRNLLDKEFDLELEEDIWKALFNGRIGNTMSVLIKKDLINKIGGWNTDMESSQERELFFRILQNSPRVLRSYELNNVVIKRPNSISTNPLKKNQNAQRYVNLRVQILEYMIEQKIESFEANKNWYLNEIVRSLSLTYKFDKDWSLAQYKKFEKFKFNLVPSNGISSMYSKLFNILGFKRTEQIYSLLKK